MLSRLSKFVSLIVLLGLFLLFQPLSFLKGATPEKVYFVSDRDEPGNYDIYSMDENGSNINRLTSNSSIDNHPDISPNGKVIVFSSNRNVGNKNPQQDFELFIANPNNIDGTAKQLTFNNYADRHPHFSPNGKRIIYDAKYRKITLKEPLSDQCSIPTPPDENPPYTYRYEGLRVIKTKSGGKLPVPKSPSDKIPIEIISLNLVSANPIRNLWPNNTRTYAGHPNFSPSGKKIVFSGSVDGQGNNWEVYTINFNAKKNSIFNLKKVTNGPTIGSNPIKMSGGAHFTKNGKSILFTSTRNVTGTSHIYRVSASAQNASVGSSKVTQITNKHGNDYVPEPMADKSIIFTSDRPDVETDNCPPSTDLDIFKLPTTAPEGPANPVQNLTNNDNADEMQLIGDEVSWFCGLPANLSECKYYPKIMKLQQLKIMHDWQTELPQNFPSRDLYGLYGMQLNRLLNPIIAGTNKRISKWNSLIGIINELNDPVQYELHKNDFVVVPTIMGDIPNDAPFAAANPKPANGFRINSFFDVFFEWSPSSDNDVNTNEIFTYDLYFGNQRNPIKIIAANLEQPSYRLHKKLKPNTRYFWRIVAKDSMGGQKDGSIWSFKSPKIHKKK